MNDLFYSLKSLFLLYFTFKITLHQEVKEVATLILHNNKK